VGGSTPARSARTPAPVNIPATGPGWDAKHVYIGVTTVNDFDTVAATLGLKGVNPGNQDKDAETMASALNRAGGIFGRSVVVAFDDMSSASVLVDPDQDASQACVHFTQDRPVIAVFNTLSPLDTPAFEACFADAKVPLFNGSIQPTGTAALAGLGGYVTPIISPSFTDLAPVWVQRLAAEHYFTGWNAANGSSGSAAVKVGIIAKDNPTSTKAASTLAGALARAGHAPVAQFDYTSGASGITTNLSSAVLQFRARGVTHVIGVDGGISSFMSQAEAQRYYPRYGLSTLNTPESTLANGNVNALQLRGAIGVGWDPPLDVAFAQDPGDISSAEKSCLANQQRAQSYAGLRFAVAIGLEYCDTFSLIKADAVAGGGLTGPDLVRGQGIAGPRFIPAGTFRSGLRPGNPGLPGAGRDFQWSSKCSCFGYLSSTDYSFAG
jgi:hypothetical protein